MIYNYKLDFFNKLAFLNELASKGISSFPNEVSLFIMRELEMRSVVLLSESENNSYSVIGRTASAERIFDIGEIFNLKNSKRVADAQKFNDSFVTQCELDVTSFDHNVQSIAFGYNNNSIGIILLSHKILPAEENQKIFFSIAEVVSKLLTIWTSVGGVVTTNSNLQFAKLISKSTKGFRKSVQTINGLVALLNEENLSDTVSNYVKDIKDNNQFMSNGINDMIELTKFEEEDFILNSSSTDIQKIIDESIKSYNSNICSKLSFNVENKITENVDLDKNLFTNIFQSLIVTSCLVSEDKNINISCKLSSSSKIYFSVSTYAPQIHSSDLQNFKDPFVITDLYKRTFASTSGLSLTLVKKIIDQINGTFKIAIDEKDQIKFLIAFKTATKRNEKTNDEISTDLSLPKNKILVIESDMASSTLLQKYLSKWNYKTEFVNSGNRALSLLEKDKYVSIILNIDQENENSLELLQKIKNNSKTRNTPVIVFSIEPEKEQVFLMGSVDYLVKPINYNNLVEILTSYKLRRNSNVLCIDDDKPTLKLVEQAIKTAGFNVI
ncbi:MAG: response regulator, partial [Ignavibacteriae bacterium]|nr:response regulator [Ignavibacteriota bacterium]